MTATTIHSASRTTSPSPVVVFGIDSRGKAKGARFGRDNAELAIKAAGQLQLRVLANCDPTVAEIAARLPVGRVHAKGRTFVPFIKRDLYERLLAASPAAGFGLASNTSGASDPKGSGSGSNGNRHNLPADWQHIAIGDLIVAQEGIEDGWYEAIVMDISGEILTLRWRDYPRERKFSRHRHRIGLLFPNPKSDTKSETSNKSTSKAGKPGAASKSDTEHALPRTWDEIDVGALVLARDEGPFHAWWEAVPIERTGNSFKLKWRDHGVLAPIVRPRLQLALIYPA